MYYAIAFLVCFELFLSFFLERLIKLLSYHKQISEKQNQHVNSEISRIEEELKDLNKPSTFTEYVKKSRQLNILKQNLNESSKQEINEAHIKKLNASKKLLRGIYLTLIFINFLTPKIRQFLTFHIIKLYVNEYYLIIPFNQKLYFPFFQTKEKVKYINALLSYGVTCTLTELIKNLITFSLFSNTTRNRIFSSKFI